EEERARLLVLEREARQLAETANRMKDEFLATLSHELRTPLNAILGWAHLLNTAPLDEATARAQGQLIADLLDVSRIITGKLQLALAPVSLQQVVAAVLDGVRPAAEAKRITVAVVAETAGMVAGDADRLQQVVWNLLSNAIKFTPQ